MNLSLLSNKEELPSLKPENYHQQPQLDQVPLITLEIGLKEPTDNGPVWPFHQTENMEFQKDLFSHIQLSVATENTKSSKD